MKYRPLPPPPRPPREKRQFKSTEYDDKYDHDDSGERCLPTTLEDISRISSQDVEEIEVEEVEASTQTDPQLEEFYGDDVDTHEENVTQESYGQRSKTLEDILKEEQQAELDRAKQIADEECITKGIQKFREANQRSFSERSRGSTADRPRTPASRPITPASRPITPASRPITPSAVVVEKRITLSTTETDARLIVQPVEDNLAVLRIDSLDDDNDIKFTEDTIDTEDERIVSEAIRRYKLLDEEIKQLSAMSHIQAELAELKQSSAENLEDLGPERDISPPPAPLERPSPLRQQRASLERYLREPSPSPPPRRMEKKSTPKEESPQPPVIPPRPTTFEIREEEQFEEELPHPPPRRKSSLVLEPTPASPSTTITEMEPINEQQIQTPDPPLELLPNGRFHVAQLEVENLNVNAIQAGRILVSDLQAISLNSQELECRSGNLVVKGIELPAGFIEELVDRVRISEREQQQQTEQTEQINALEQPPRHEPENIEQNRDAPPARPPPPQSLYPSDYAPYSIPPPSFYNLRNYSDEPEPMTHNSPTSTRRRRHHRRRDESTSEEDYQREQRRSRHGTRSPEPSITDLSVQLIKACSLAVARSGSRLMIMLRSRSKDETGRQEVHLGLILVIVILAVLMMLGMGADRAVHHHHWDYFNPPDNEGRK